MVTNFKTSDKNNDLVDTLFALFGKTINLARIKFLSKMIKTIVILRTVNFAKLSTAFGGRADSLSSMRRIQRFMSGYDFDFSLVAKLIFKLLPHKGPYVLSMDRTNWQFGSFDINALVLAVTYQGIAFPLLFKLLPKKSNSNTKERIDLMERFSDYETVGGLFRDATADSVELTLTERIWGMVLELVREIAECFNIEDEQILGMLVNRSDKHDRFVEIYQLKTAS